MKLRAGHIKILRKRVMIVERVVVEMMDTVMVVVVALVSSLNVDTNLQVHQVFPNYMAVLALAQA